MYTFCRHIKTNGLRCESPAFLFPCSLFQKSTRKIYSHPNRTDSVC